MKNSPQTTQALVVNETKETNVIRALNTARSMELYALSQYMDQHYVLHDIDYGELAANIKLISIDEMRHAELLGERIKELGGAPTHTLGSPIQKGQPVESIFPFNSELESRTMAEYNTFKMVCVENKDSVSAELFETIIAEELAHYNYFCNVSEHMKTLGNSYLAKIAGTSSSTGPASKGFV